VWERAQEAAAIRNEADETYKENQALNRQQVALNAEVRLPTCRHPAASSRLRGTGTACLQLSVHGGYGVRDRTQQTLHARLPERSLAAQVRDLKGAANAAADEAASAKFRLQTARQAAAELRELIVEARRRWRRGVRPWAACLQCSGGTSGLRGHMRFYHVLTAHRKA